MHITEFDYHLPQELIAQEPLAERDASRMLVLDRAHRSWSDTTFRSFVDYLQPGDVVVVNNTRVIPARLVGRRRGSGGRVEIFLVRLISDNTWTALIRPGGRLKEGAIVDFEGELSAEITDGPGTELRHVTFECSGSFDQLLERVGQTPLPPYIKREQTSADDRERYQTVYARQRGAIAAPTAGLHFTPSILTEVRRRVRVADITLHVGYGTFEPVRVDNVENHRVTGEHFEIDEQTAKTINETKASGGRVIAVGTTTVRALESSADDDDRVSPQTGEADLTIVPNYRFRVVDALLTNFHLPRSSLLLLVSAFAGKDFVLDAYKHAVEQRYRFYSYGDCMLIL